jgi:type I restriction enzyme, S subunit
VSEWKELPLSEVVQLIGGGTPKTSVSEYWNGDIPWLSVVDFNTGRKYVSDTEKKITSAGLVNSSTKMLNAGDIILSARGTVGAMAVLTKSMAFNQSCYGLRGIANKSDTTFIYYLVKDAVAGLQQISHGGVFDTITKDTFKDISLPIPAIEEQKAIASVLSSLDHKIDLLHRQNTTLEAMAETLFRQWFVEEAQEDWEEKPLKEVCLINNGYAFQSETYKETGQKIIRTMNFNNHWIEFNSLVYISEELAKSFNKYYLKRNDFLLVMVGASLGNFAIVTDDVIPSLQNQNMWCFRAHENLFQHYLNFAMRNIINDALHGASGSAREFFQKGVFYEIKIPTPPNELVLKFHEISESYFAKIELNRKQIQTLEKLRDNLLPKLMSGEVRVKL